MAYIRIAVLSIPCQDGQAEERENTWMKIGVFVVSIIIHFWLEKQDNTTVQ
jgi:hypothetical protein